MLNQCNPMNCTSESFSMTIFVMSFVEYMEQLPVYLELLASHKKILATGRVAIAEACYGNS